LRFARLRLEKRHNYLRKVSEITTQLYIANDKVNVTGLIIAGIADFKTELSQSDMFDSRLAVKILKIVDVSYGGDNGFNQAIELSADVLRDVKFIREKKLLTKYFEEIAQDTGKYCFGVRDTMQALELGAVESLIVYENLEMNRYELKNPATAVTVVHFLNKEQEKDPKYFHDEANNVEMEVIDKLALVEWFANNYTKFGAKLEYVSNKSQEESQFVKGFGGIGGLLRYRVDFMEMQVNDDNDDEDDDYYDEDIL